VLDKTTTIENFLEAAAAKQPTPGGGSVAALAGALAAAMGEMVVNYSVGKKGLEEHDERLKSVLAKFRLAREMTLELMAEDQAAYEALTKARKTPLGDRDRESSIATASQLCIDIPRSLAVIAVSIIGMVDITAEIANPYLLSDLAVCAELAMATTRAAIYNVRVNLPEVSDAQQRGRIEEASNQLLSQAVGQMQRVIPKIWQRVSKG
jgi:formiminotetrahydrofolate cyclodeaminase